MIRSLQTLYWASGAQLTRPFSSNASVLKDTVKQRLRELYKRVHPDLFHADKAAQVRRRPMSMHPVLKMPLITHWCFL